MIIAAKITKRLPKAVTWLNSLTWASGKVGLGPAPAFTVRFAECSPVASAQSAGEVFDTLLMTSGLHAGLFDWSMKFQDGTSPTDYNPEALTPEKKAW